MPPALEPWSPNHQTDREFPVKTFFDKKKKKREMVASRSVLQGIVKEVLQREGKQCINRLYTWKRKEEHQRKNKCKCLFFIFLGHTVWLVGS